MIGASHGQGLHHSGVQPLIGVVFSSTMTPLLIFILFGGALLRGAGQRVCRRILTRFAVNARPILHPVSAKLAGGPRACGFRPQALEDGRSRFRLLLTTLGRNFHCNLPFGLFRHLLVWARLKTNVKTMKNTPAW